MSLPEHVAGHIEQTGDRIADTPFEPAESLAGDEVHRKLTVIIPCYNERATILDVIERVKRIATDKFIIVIENCSTDGSRELLRSVCGDERPFRCRNPHTVDFPSVAGQRWMDGDGFGVLLQPLNLQKGTSVKTGVALANSDYVICQDADLEYDPNDIMRLLDHAERTGLDAVFGSRLLDRRRPPLSALELGRVALTKIFRVLYRSPITDVATCYKLMKTNVARGLQMEASGFDLDFEIPAKLMRRRNTVSEIPISYVPRSRAGGKKIRWWHGFSAVWTLIRLRRA
ncbi:MAG TPA: glycosyltransferase family 2 protein [Polyangiaceae bacterium]|nr:glycosyltransferase family 2 protein [Polyangiaceae bacterium]